MVQFRNDIVGQRYTIKYSLFLKEKKKKYYRLRKRLATGQIKLSPFFERLGMAPLSC
jgi:hypothetical protein